MNKLNKILIISVMLSCFILNFVSADDTSDCGRFGSMSYSDGGGSFETVNLVRETNSNRFTNFLTIDQQKAIITKNDLNTAILNLKKFCCENKLGDLTADTCKKDEPYFNENVPDSKYLFDHLFDVIMRRLNGLGTDIDIYTKTNMTLDDKGSKRREWIDSQAEATAGSTPQTIINKYQDVWKQSPSSKGYNITKRIYTTFGDLDSQNFLIYVSGNGESDDSEIVSNAMKNYDQRTLYDRYINACALGEYFYALLNLRENSYDGKVVSDDKKIITNKISDQSCEKIIKRQIDGENHYVILVIQKSSNLFLSNYVQGYISYMYERQLKLQKLWQEASNRWLDVVRAVPNLEKRTVK